MIGDEENAVDTGNAAMPTDGEPGPAVEQLPVKLVFVAGELQVPLGELRTQGPGHVYDLKGCLDGHVEIRANDRIIGLGELVELEGRIGVRVVECR